jgi:hypothetical protein
MEKDNKQEKGKNERHNTGTEDDGLNLEDHRISQDFESNIRVKKAIISIPVRRPGKQEFFRVHPKDDMSFKTYALKVDADNEFYVVKPDLLSEVADCIIPVVLFTTINTSESMTLWPVKLPGSDGKMNSWNQSAVEIAAIAKEKWVRLTSNRSIGAYEPLFPVDPLEDPEWPDMNFQEIFRIAFKNHYIDSPEHPVLKNLKGRL